jgi:Ribosomal_S17 N-terminal
LNPIFGSPKVEFVTVEFSTFNFRQSHHHQQLSNMAELTVQSERAYLKQPHIFQNPKTAGKSTKQKRWYKDVGLGFKTPKEAIDGTYIGTDFPID